MAELPKSVRDAMVADVREVMDTAAQEFFADPQGQTAAGRDLAAEYTDAAIAALFGACEVREEYAMRLTWGPTTESAGLVQDFPHHDERAVDRAVAQHVGLYGDIAPSKIRRLVITTAAEDITEEVG